MSSVQHQLNETIKEFYKTNFVSYIYKGIKISDLLKVNSYWHLMDIDKTKVYSNPSFDTFNKGAVCKLLYQPQLRISIRSKVLHLIDLFKKQVSGLNSKFKTYEFDILISIESNKYLNYVESVINQLKLEQKSIVVINWQEKEVTEIYQDNYNVISLNKVFVPTIPAFWSNSYWEFRSITNQIDRILSINKKYRPKKVLLIEGDHPIQHIFGWLFRTKKIETVCLQWGYCGTSTYKLPWQDMPYSKFLSWGEFFTQSYQKVNPGLKIYNVGHPRLYAREKPSDIKDTILFALPKEMPPFINKNDVANFLKYAIGFSKKQSRYKVRFRTHPNFNASIHELSDIELHNYDKHSFEDSFMNVKYCISISSTLNLESIHYGVIPIYLKVNQIPLLLHDEVAGLLGSNIIIDLDEDIESTIDKIESISDVTRLNNILFAAVGNHAIHNICNHLK